MPIPTICQSCGLHFWPDDGQRHDYCKAPVCAAVLLAIEDELASAPETYGGRAPHQGVDTSVAAASSIESELNKLQLTVLGYFKIQGERGATDEQAHIALGMNPSTERPRRRELYLKGLIRYCTDEHGEPVKRATASGRSAFVYVAS